MSTYTAQRPSPGLASFPSQSPISPAYEPDEEWKAEKKKQIEEGMKTMIQEAKDRLEANMQALSERRDTREWLARRQELVAAFDEESDLLRALARDEFTERLQEERLVRRMTNGLQSVLDEQAAIYAQIQRQHARRDSTAEDDPANIAATSSSSPIIVPQRNSDSAPSPSSYVPVRDPSSSRRSSPEMSRPPGKPNHPDPPPIQARPAPPASPTEPRYGSPGRNASSPVYERRTTAPSPLQERRTAAPGPFPASDGAPPADPRMSTAPLARASSSSRRAAASPPVSPAPTNARFFDQSSRQASNSPVQERMMPAHPQSHPQPHPPAMPPPTRPSGSLNRRTSQTWKEATRDPAPSIPIPIPKENSSRPSPAPSSSLHTKRSQSSFNAAKSWMGPPLTDEPEEAPPSTFGGAVPMSTPSRRSKDPAPEKPIGDSPPAAAARPPPQVWNPPTNPENSTPPLRLPQRDRNGSKRGRGGARKPIPASLAEARPPSPPPIEEDDEVARNAAREAAERQELEQQWTSYEKGKEKESLGRAAGRRSTASEQVREHVSGGPASDVVGSSTVTYAAASPSYGAAASPYGAASSPAPTTAFPPESIPYSSPLRSTHPSRPFIHTETGAETDPDTEDDEEDEDDDGDEEEAEPEPDPESEESEEEKLPRRTPSVYSFTYSSRSSESTSHGPPPSSSTRYSSHTAARSRAVAEEEEEEEMPAAYSAGEYSRTYGSFNRPSSAAEREWDREQRERDERERQHWAEKAAKKLAEEAERKAEEVRLKEEATQKKEAELRHINEREAKLQQREAEMRRKEEETRQKEAETRQRETETRLREAARQREEAEKQRKEKEKLQAEAEKQRKERERLQAEAEKQRWEAAERQRKEQERLLAEAEKQRWEAAEKQRKEKERLQAEAEKQRWEHREEAEKQRKEKERLQAEAEKLRLERERFLEGQRRESEIKERRRQGSMDADANWHGPSPSNTTSSSARSNSTAGSSSTGWSSTSKASSASSQTSSASGARPTPATPNSKPTWTSSTPSSPYTSTAGSKPTPKTGTSNPPPVNLEDRARRQREQAEEQFRKMQEQMERERRAKEQKAGRMLSKEDVVQIYQQHEQMWAKMGSAAQGEVTWDMLPWPVYKRPNSAEEITSGAVDAYIMSPHYPDPEKSTKDRVRQQLRKWHEDHFNQKVLSKVGERDKERVKAAAGTVTRNLNNLLERANESKKAGSSVFA
ncbi:hypothetical protein C8R46DRAFT_1147288 [Mycena filopes]|nr:hypothetical protein C8R46DRAFT_1147288 [Mycena filopes]